MHQSLYRLWRPKRFGDMVGQEAIVKTLQNQVRTGQFAHAYLFCGTRGTGKTSLARILAMAVNCLDLKDGDACLACESCKTLQNESSLDVFEMDAASNSRVEEIRDMLEKVNYPPQFSKRKVYIIDEVHMLSNAAFNALLKTLEEPPAYMVFILATTEPQKIPATILSRCQRFDFGRLSETQITGRLQEALTDDKPASQEALQLIAAAAEGSMRDAWSLLDLALSSGEALTETSVRRALGSVDRERLHAFVDSLSRNDTQAAMEAAETLHRQGFDIPIFLKDLGLYARQLLALKLGAGQIANVSDEWLSAVQQQAKAVSLGFLKRLMADLMEAERTLRFVSSPRLPLMHLILNLTALSETSAPVVSPQPKTRSLPKDEPAAVTAPPQGAEPVAVAAAEPVHAADPETASAQVQSELAEPNGDVLDAVREAVPDQAPATQETALPVDMETKPEPNDISPPMDTPFASAPSPEPDKGQQSLLPDPCDVWQNFLTKSVRSLPSIARMLKAGRFVGCRNGLFELGFKKGETTYVTFLMMPDRQQLIEKELTALWGSPARFAAIEEDNHAQVMQAQQKVQQDIDQLAQALGRENIIVTD